MCKLSDNWCSRITAKGKVQSSGKMQRELADSKIGFQTSQCTMMTERADAYKTKLWLDTMH